MKAWKRVLIGVAFGGLLPLLFHPASRNYFDAIWRPRNAYSSIRLPADNSGHMDPGQPNTVDDASLWALIAMERLESEGLSPDEIKTTLAVISAAEKRDMENGYWPQIEAVLYWSDRQQKKALEKWQRAATCLRWNDGQSTMLIQAADKLAKRTGARQSWQLARVYFGRSVAAVDLIESFAERRVLDGVYPTETATLRMRYLTLLNGNLIRQFGRSYAISNRGAEIVRRACQPNRLPLDTTPRQYLTYSLQFFNDLRLAGLREESVSAKQKYDETESWQALIGGEIGSEPRNLAYLSVVYATLPGALALGGLFGGLLWLLGTWIRRTPIGETWFESPYIFFLAAVTGVICWLFTGVIEASISIPLCLAFLAIRPRKVRSRPSYEFGPTFIVTMYVLGLLVLIFQSVYWILLSPAAVQVLPHLDWNEEAIGSSAFMGIAAMILALAILSCPWFAYTNRTRPSQVFAGAMIQLGSFVFTIGIMLAIIFGGICIYKDRDLQVTLAEIVQNEPQHYYIQRLH
ncbi:MAG: hypothetical protein JSS72_09880 [Armatimonadetes bacterium]|nr:hypothetical protein [Armatimonadota bacterium]